MDESQGLARGHQPFVHLCGHLRGNKELVAKLAQIGNTLAEDFGKTDVDGSGGAKWKGIVAQVLSGEALKQGAALWALNIELGPRTCDICHKGLRALKVALHPCLHVAKARVGGEHKELLRAKFGDRQVGLDAAANVQPLCVGDPFGVAVYVVGAEPVEQTSSIAALYVEFGHE